MEAATIIDSENVARILSNKWVVDGVILHMAFTLREGETYISVNRPSVATYQEDVSTFVATHPDFYLDDNHFAYQRALLNTGKVRSIVVLVDEKPLNVSVEVEPRDVFTKSHAGIFTRLDGTILKPGKIVPVEGLEKDVPVDDILLEVRSQLIDRAQLEQLSFKPQE